MGCGMSTTSSPVNPTQANLARAKKADEMGEPNPNITKDPRHKGHILEGGGMTGWAYVFTLWMIYLHSTNAIYRQGGAMSGAAGGGT